MATNLFEKYGIKEVADVTLFRIEKKDETYESQRKISISSILKSALSKRMVYPLDQDGKGEAEGYEALVFTEANILTHYNYDCDDNVTYTGTAVYESDSEIANWNNIDLFTTANPPAWVAAVDADESELEVPLSSLSACTYQSNDITQTDVEEDGGVYRYTLSFSATFTNTADKSTGIYPTATGSTPINPDADYTGVGTHEFTYAEQLCMLFAKNQNLITKAGTRYKFANPDTLFTGFEFNDNFAVAPNSREKVVVVGLSGKFTEVLYDENEINDAIKQIDSTIEAKAYDVTYSDYAELIVEDEMGLFLPQQIGSTYDRSAQTVTFFSTAPDDYKTWAQSQRGIDVNIYTAIDSWDDGLHDSINDAIDALRQKSKVLDNGGDFSKTGHTRVFGGYRVKAADVTSVNNDSTGSYNYYFNGSALTDAISGTSLTSGYGLDSVLTALATANYNGQTGPVRITDGTTSLESNRAIYIDSNDTLMSNKAAIYILTNANKNALNSDKVGIFEFHDKKGNKLYYQDTVFAGTETLALITIGNVGIIFVVDRCGNKNINKIAWMVNDNGYITDKQAKKIVDNGLIHIVDINICNDIFDATCTVGAMKIRRITKNVLHYTPVLFLDTLRVSTLEQAVESTSARGGRGNAKLITWDYGKEITLSIEDALFTPASMAAVWGGENGDLKEGVKDAKKIDRFQKYTAKRNFIVPAGNFLGTPTEGDVSAQAVYYDPKTMEPYQDGTPIAVGEVYYKFTRSVAYGNNSLGKKIEVSADKFPGTYRIIGETLIRNKDTEEDQRFQFVIPEAKMSASDASITLEAEGDPTVFSFTMDVLRPESGVMMELIQFDTVENEEQNDGSDMIKDTEDLNLLDDAEIFKVSGGEEEELVIGATEY